MPLFSFGLIKLAGKKIRAIFMALLFWRLAI
jgi:hypothetical protein